MRSSYLSRLLLVTGAFAAAVATARCADFDASAPATRTPQPPLSADRAAAAVAHGLTPHGLPQVNWMAEIHTKAVQEAMSVRSELKALNAGDRCARIEGIVRKFVPDIARATGITDPAFYEARFADARSHIGCGNTTPLSVWGLPTSPPTQEELVTGEFQLYTPPMESAVLNASTPAEAVAGIDAALAAASASGLRTPDFEVLAGLASIAASSTYYWYDVEVLGGFDGGGEEQLMSIYPLVACRFFCRVGWGDLAGGIIGGLLSTPGGAAAVLAGSLVGAAIGSIATAAALLM